MFDKLFAGMSRMGEKKVRVKFKILIKDINFQTNNYFMKNSTYSIFQVKNHKQKVKSKKNLFTMNDLKNIPLGEVLKFYATLYKNDEDKYSSKTRRLIIRQNNIIDCEDVYKDIGFIDLPLDKIVSGTQELNCKLQVKDADNMLKAHINVSIRYKFKKEGERDEEDDDVSVANWEEDDDYTGNSKPLAAGSVKQKSALKKTKSSKFDLSETKKNSSDIIDDDDSVDSRYVPPAAPDMDLENLDIRYVTTGTVDEPIRRGSGGGGSVGGGLRVGGGGGGSVRGDNSVSGSVNTRESPVYPVRAGTPPLPVRNYSPSGSVNSGVYSQPRLEQWQVEQERQLALLQQQQQQQQQLQPRTLQSRSSDYAMVPPPMPINPPVPPVAVHSSFYAAAQSQQAQLEQAYSQQNSSRSVQSGHSGRETFTPQSSIGSNYSQRQHSNGSVNSQSSSPYQSPFQSQHAALQQAQYQSQNDYMNNSRRSQYSDVGIAVQQPSYAPPPVSTAASSSIFQQQLQQQQQYEQQRNQQMQQQLREQPPYRQLQYPPASLANDPYGDQYSPPSTATSGSNYPYSYDDQLQGVQDPYYDSTPPYDDSPTYQQLPPQQSSHYQYPAHYPGNYHAGSRQGSGGSVTSYTSQGSSQNRVRFDDNTSQSTSRSNQGRNSRDNVNYQYQQHGGY